MSLLNIKKTKILSQLPGKDYQREKMRMCSVLRIITKFCLLTCMSIIRSILQISIRILPLNDAHRDLPHYEHTPQPEPKQRCYRNLNDKVAPIAFHQLQDRKLADTVTASQRVSIQAIRDDILVHNTMASTHAHSGQSTFCRNSKKAARWRKVIQSTSYHPFLSKHKTPSSLNPQLQRYTL